jgi:competence ComEA-like helix-hairpin-helix protein
MRLPHPSCTGALAVVGGLGLIGLAWARSAEATLRFPPDDPPGTGVPAWRVDLDRAGVDELGLLPGVGEKLAERIVADRARRGSFGGVAGLDRVPGVGPAVIERIRPFVR